jgi:hypothetical protein
MDEFRISIIGDFVLSNDNDEALPEFTFVGIKVQAALVDEAKSTHSCAKVNKQRSHMYANQVYS